LAHKEIKVFAPASVTNVGCGFDILGFAVEWPGDELILRLKKEPGIFIRKIYNDDGRIPLNPEENTAGRAVLSLYNYLKLDIGLELEIYKKMPLCSGLGSSAASAVAAVFALNELLDKPLNKNELLPFALEGEKISSGGNIHADNTAASLFGGFILVRSMQPLEIINLDYPENLYCVVIHPQIELPTSEMRRIIPTDIPLSLAVTQWGNIAGMVAGLMKNDLGLISRSMDDKIIEPVRSQKIPGFYAVKDAAMNAGALGSSISGSGPSVFALCDSKETSRSAGEKMKAVFASLKIESDIYVSKINKSGPVVLEIIN